MNKKAITAVIVILVLVVGLYGAYRVYKHFKRLATPVAQTTVSTANTPNTGMSSLKDLIGKGIAETCTFSENGNNGTVSLSGGKVRGDFDSTTDGKTTKSHMIVDGTTSYIWMDGEPSGFKMTFDPSATPSTGGSKTQPAGGVDASASMNYNCNPGVVDASLFTLPKGINFMTFNSGSIPAVPSASSVPVTAPTNPYNY